MYDVTDRGTFNSVSNWVAQIQMVRFCSSQPFSLSKVVPYQHADVNVNKILVGNKTDKEDMRVSRLSVFLA